MNKNIFYGIIGVAGVLLFMAMLALIELLIGSGTMAFLSLVGFVWIWRKIYLDLFGDLQ